MDWEEFCICFLLISVSIMVLVVTMFFGVGLTRSFAKETDYKCDTEKQEEFILKCITINPNNKDQPAIIKECNESAKIFCTPEIILNNKT